MVIVKEDKPALQDESRDTKGRFKPGYSGNPKGQPLKENSITGHIRRLLAEEHDGTQTKGELIARKLIALALDGDRQAVDMVLDRMEGRPAQTLVHDTVRESTQSLLEGLAANRNGGSDAIQEQGRQTEEGQGEASEVKRDDIRDDKS